MVPIIAVLQGANVATRLAAFAGVMDALGPRLDRLLQADLRAGMDALKQAQLATTEQDHLLREARASFNRAVSLEEGHRKAAALFGLATCHHELGEKVLHFLTLEQILEIEPIKTTDLAWAIGQSAARLPLHAGKNLVQSASLNSLKGLLQSPLKSAAQLIPSKDEALKRLNELMQPETRQEFIRRRILDAMETNVDCKKLMQLQDEIAKLIDKPIPWLEKLAMHTAQQASDSA